MSETFEGDRNLTGAERAAVADARRAARSRFAHFVLDDVSEGESGPVDPDNPPMTDAELTRLHLASDIVPGFVKASLQRRGGRPRSPAPKVAVSLRLDPDVLAALRASGDGWQGRVNDTLRAALGLPNGSDVAATVRSAVSGRAFNRGSVRVHTVVESREVSESLTLELETVTVDRRVADRFVAVGTTGGDVREDMDVVGSDGVLVGRVDLVEAGRLRVNTGEQHHYLPREIVESVADRVKLSVTAYEAEARWITA